MNATRCAIGALALLAATAIVASQAAAAGSGYHVIDKLSGPDGGWDYIRVDEANNRVLAAHGGSVVAADLATKVVTGDLAKGAILHDPLPVNGGAEVAVTNGGTQELVFYNAKTWTEVARVKTGVGPDAAAFDPKTGLVLVMDHRGGDITLVDPKAHKAVGAIAVGGDLEAAAVDGAGHAWVNVENKNEIVAIDLVAKTAGAHYALTGCDGPTGLAYDAPDKQLIAACNGATVVVDAASGKVAATAATGKGADGVAFDAKQKLAFVPSGPEGQLYVVSIGKGKAAIVDKVTTQVSARTIAIDSRSGRVYLPAAEYGPRPAGGGRPPMVPGSFKILVVGK